MDDSTARHQVHSQVQQGDMAVQQVYTSSSHEPVTTMGEQHSSAPFQQAFSSIQEDIPVEILAEQHPNLVIQEMSPSLAQLNESQSEVHTCSPHLHSQAKISAVTAIATSEQLAVQSAILEDPVAQQVNGNASSVMSEGSSMLAVQFNFLADAVVLNGNIGSVMFEGNSMLTHREILVHHSNPSPLLEYSRKSVVMPLVILSAIPTLIHVGIIAYGFVQWKGLNFIGGPVTTSISLWISLILVGFYVLYAKKFKNIWRGISMESFQYLFTNLKLAFAMVCLEYWAFEFLVGLMPDCYM
ncbi:transmembrane protein, putative [Medicago truncatula]|uniref:Transmembrane protein, putative n=1 Tax=Medicago truncatula TaxID=3880 RepID=A0A072UJA2_MEDTR|nr:transmembrane protein, putative [Medicago truncatula]